MILSLTDAKLDYPKTTAFQHFSLSVKAGEMVSIIGPSGCGKTSLLYAIAGLLPLSGGTMQRTVGNEGGIALMFQQDRLLPGNETSAMCCSDFLGGIRRRRLLNCYSPWDLHL